ncbi:hypothetical protein ACFQ3H_12775, partial [Paralysiella testudinis]|uniref:hypothetical protein n=1 Tax=Paralysiella testudinis TaxID=2809020 RepID=UPI00362892FB
LVWAWWCLGEFGLGFYCIVFCRIGITTSDDGGAWCNLIIVAVEKWQYGVKNSRDAMDFAKLIA